MIRDKLAGADQLYEIRLSTCYRDIYSCVYTPTHTEEAKSFDELAAFEGSRSEM
jgi:hypothetical protein